jgi:hypothetical protein
MMNDHGLVAITYFFKLPNIPYILDEGSERVIRTEMDVKLFAGVPNLLRIELTYEKNEGFQTKIH